MGMIRPEKTPPGSMSWEGFSLRIISAFICHPEVVDTMRILCYTATRSVLG